MGFRIHFKGPFLEKFVNRFGVNRACIKIDFTYFYWLKNPNERSDTKEFWQEYATRFPEEVCEKFEFFLENFEPGCVDSVC